MDSRHQILRKPKPDMSAKELKAHELTSNTLLKEKPSDQPADFKNSHKTFRAGENQPELLSASANFLAEDSMTSHRRKAEEG